jgi:hypothetical protein
MMVVVVGLPFGARIAVWAGKHVVSRGDGWALTTSLNLGR